MWTPNDQGARFSLDAIREKGVEARLRSGFGGRHCVQRQQGLCRCTFQ